MSDITNLVSAVVEVMRECKGVEKALDVGKGANSYKGVSAKDVFLKVSESMAKHGLAVFPIDIDETTEFQEYVDQYGNKKQRFFTRVKVKYELTHVSGESKICYGIGHGADALDKACGKAMTYALKTFCIYQFFIATGHIDDADQDHSDNLSNETQKPNGFRDNAIDPFVHGDELINQVLKVISGIHKNIGSSGQIPSFEDFKNAPIKEMADELALYRKKEAEYNYFVWVQKKLQDPSEIWTLDRLSKLKQKCLNDKALTNDVESIIDQKAMEISQ